ncbi:MAG TPA: S-layer homology domain-containing protein [Chloroflexia bacterium]|nr:S-layer homology domain-containing protein [Chloroflexia bacterium]
MIFDLDGHKKVPTMSRSLAPRVCLVVAALATTIALSLALSNAPNSTLAAAPINSSNNQIASDPVSRPEAGCWSVYGQPVGIGSSLQDVVALAPDNVWGVGKQTVDGRTSNLVVHWTGDDWHLVSSPNAGSYSDVLFAIAAISSDDIWAAGISDETNLLLMHWDGTVWTISPSPPISGQSADLSAVSTNDVWAVSRMGVVHWDGTQWVDMQVPVPPTGFHTSIAAVASDDAWVEDLTVDAAPIQYHWDGTQWNIVYSTSYGSTQFINGTAALASDDIWAVGYYAGNYPSRTLIKHWNGTQWSITASPNPTGTNVLNDVTFLSPSDGWAVGSNNGTYPLLMHWDGSAWSLVTLPGLQSNYGALNDIAPVSPTDIWAVGSYVNAGWPFTIRYSDPCVVPTATSTATSTATPIHTATPSLTPNPPTITSTPTYISLPAQWVSVTPPNPGAGSAALIDLDVLTATDIWAVGFYDDGPSGSIALRWNGSAWSKVSLPVYSHKYHLVSVSVDAHNDVWALSGERDALHWDGTSWTNHPIVEADEHVGKVAAIAPNDVWATGVAFGYKGEYSTPFVTHWDGVRWSEAWAGTCFYSCFMNAFYVISANDIWAGGTATTDSDRGFAVHYNGSTWTEQYDPLISAGRVVTAVSGTSSSDVWLSTLTNFLHWDGTVWTPFQRGAQVNDMVSVSPSDVWAAGGDAFLHWDGMAWGRVPNPPNQTYISAIDAANCGDVWAVGGSDNSSNHGMLLAHYSGPCPPQAPTVTPTPTPIPTPRCAGERFTDVCPDDYFYQHVLDLNDLGVIAGYYTAPPCDGPAHIPCFKPYNWSTRGQIAKIVSLAAGFNEDVTGQTFEDVAPDHTFYQYVERMASRGIIAGYPCGGAGEPCNANNDPYFRPGNTVSRGQLTKMVSIAFGFDEPVSGQFFEDVPPGHTFYEYIQRLAGRGIISGYPCGGVGEPCNPGALPFFRPGNVISRGQIAKVVNLARTQSIPTPTPGATGTTSPEPSPTATLTGTPTETPVPTATGTPTVEGK